MKWPKGRLAEKESISFFIPEGFKKVEITESDWESFFALSERGVKPKQTLGTEAICWGKVWRGRFCESSSENRAIWEEGILEGTVPYYTILGGEEGDEPVPRSVVDFMKRTLFKGIDAELIETVYQWILDEKTNRTVK